MTSDQTQGSQSPAQENTRTRFCKNCEAPVTETYQSEEKEFNKFLGRMMTVQYAQWEQKLSPFEFCSPCEEIRKEKAEREKKEQIEKDRTERIKTRCIEMLGGIKPYEEYTFEKFLATENMQAFNAARSFDPKTQNLFLYGECGTGKTHLACAIARNFFEKYCLTPGFVRYYKTVNLLRYMRYKRDAEEEEKILKEFSCADVFVLDDLGAQKETDFGTSLILEILDRRIERRQNGLIVTSNFGRTDLAAILKDRVTSRISALCGSDGVIKMTGTDHRSKKSK
jgi:DNA replication protein DnaC